MRSVVPVVPVTAPLLQTLFYATASCCALEKMKDLGQCPAWDKTVGRMEQF